ncbi:MAG: TolC family protein [Candidatus Aminicenantes bacterium]|nr:TolC family protein [Candidatus Aminicenantes bacterium]
MKRKVMIIFLISTFCVVYSLSFSWPSQAENQPIWAETQTEKEEIILKLSLNDCIYKALKNNLGLAAEMITPEIAARNVILAMEKFLPTISFNYNKQDTRSASYSFLDASDVVITRQDDYTFQLSQQLPTGASLSFSLYNYINDSNRRFQTINPRYGSTLRISFSQPLLKDFGFRIGRREVIIAKYNRDISEENFQKLLEDLIYNVESTYWNFVYSRENLKVRQQSLKLAQELLEKNKIEIEAGTLPPIERLTAEAEVSTRQADILEAEALVKNYEDQLKTIMNLAAEYNDIKKLRIIPIDLPETDKKDISYEEALKIALQKRPDLQAARTDLENRQFTLSYARNQLLPDLRLQFSYWSPGLSGDQILYKDNNALTGVIIGRIPGKKTDALKDALNFRFKNWSAAVVVNLPINSIFTRAYYAQAKLSFEQAQLRLKNQEQLLSLEISNAVRAVETNYQRAQAYRAARELAEKKLEAEQEKLKVGLSTNYLVLQYQRDLANAMTMELKALIDYNLSLANLNRVMGIGRERRNVQLITEDN